MGNVDCPFHVVGPHIAFGLLRAPRADDAPPSSKSSATPTAMIVREPTFITTPDRRGPGGLGHNPLVPYDEDLANRIRSLIAAEDRMTEKKMFGGLAFLIRGNMSVSASGQGGLLLRCDPVQTNSLLRKPHARPFQMRGRVMEGWLRVAPEGVRTKRQLEPWVARAVAYARSLPPDG
jgi:TfoX N-terminal domain